MFEVKLTAKQYAMVSECIERVSANEREFDTDSEKTLKEVAEKFDAEYKELNEEEIKKIRDDFTKIVADAFSIPFNMLNYEPVNKRHNLTTEVKDLLLRLINNAPDTYSGTNIELQQKKMFAFQKAVNDTVELLKEEI